MKKLLGGYAARLLVLLTVLLCLAGVACATSTSEVTAESLFVTESIGSPAKLYITDYTGFNKNVVVPDSIGGVKVKGIRFGMATPIAKLDLSHCDGLTSIEKESCKGMVFLTDVTLPSSVTYIDYGAFANCADLVNVDLSRCDKLTAIYGATLYSSGYKTNTGAFEGCTALASIDLSACTSLTNIGVSTFEKCANLEQVVLPSTELTLSPNAFLGCVKLTDVNVPDTLIGFGTLGMQPDITAYHASVGSGAAEAISRAGTSFVANDAELRYTFDEAKITGLVLWGWRGTGETVVLPAGVTSINDNALAGNTTIKTFDASSSATLITVGTNAFSGCTALKTVDLSGCTALTTISTGAFMNCAALTDVDVSGCDKLASIQGASFSSGYDGTGYFADPSTKKRGNGAFEGCASLAAIDLSACPALTTIGVCAFENCTLLAQVLLPDTALKLDNGAFFGCAKLASVTVPDTLAVFGTAGMQSDITAYHATLGSAAAKVISLAATNFHADSMELRYTFDGSNEVTGLELHALHSTDPVAVIPSGITSIKANAFANNTTLTTLDCSKSDTLTTIGVGAFANCSALSHVDLSGCVSLTSLEGARFSSSNYWDESNYFTNPASYSANKLDNGVFEGCTSLANIDLSVCTALTNIGKCTFQGCSLLQQVTLPATALTLDSGAFFQCDKLAGVSIPDSLTVFGKYGMPYTMNFYASMGSSAAKAISRAGSSFVSADALLHYTLSGDEITGLLLKGWRGADTVVTVPVGVTGIDRVFENNTFITALDCSDCNTLVTISDYAFSGCTLLETVDLSGCTELTTISQSSFGACPALASVDLSGCAKLNIIGSSAFAGDTTLASVDLTGCAKLSVIDSRAFSGDTMLASVDLSDCAQLSIIGDYAFYGNTTLASVDLSDCAQLSSIGENAFYGNTTLASVVLTGCAQLNIIGENAFYGCAALESIDFSGFTKLSTIGRRAFYDCEALTLVDLSGCTAFTSFSDYTFAGCDALTYLDLSECTAMTTLNGHHLWGMFPYSPLTQIDLHDGFTSCVSMYELPNIRAFHCSMGSATAHALSKANSSFEVDGILYRYLYTEGVQTGMALMGVATPVKEFTVPQGITAIGERAFYKDTVLSSILLPDTLTAIDNNAFVDCSSLTDIDLPSGIQLIDSYAFSSYITTLHCAVGSDTAKALGKVERNFVGNGYPDCSLRYLFTEGVESGLMLMKCSETSASVIVPEGVTTIAVNAFYNSGETLRSHVQLPSTLKTIDDAQCISTASLTIPEGVTTIGTSLISDSYYNPIANYSLFLPQSLQTMGSISSSVCEKLTVYCYGYTPAAAWAESHNIKKIVLLDGKVPEDYVTVRTAAAPIASVGRQADMNRLIWLENAPVEPLALLWQSSDPSLLTLDAKGLGTPTRAGNVTVTMTVEGHPTLTASVNIHCKVDIADFTVPAELVIPVGGTAVITPENRMPADSEGTFAYTSSNTLIATVDAQGVITAKSTGEADITCITDTGLSRSCHVISARPATSIQFGEPTVSLYQGQTRQLTISVYAGTQPSYVWQLVRLQSSNEQVCTIDENGMLTAIGAGNATITATSVIDAKVTGACAITVPSLDAADLPAALITIGKNAFAGTAYQLVIIPDGCVTIGERAFADCTQLLYADIPASVTAIADDAFSGDTVTLWVREGSYAKTWAEAHSVPFTVK